MRKGKNTNMETCACCGHKTIEDKGNYEICPVCLWEDDPVQEADPRFEGGANDPSLFEAQKNFAILGAKEKRFVKETRSPSPTEEKDLDWRALLEGDKEFSTTLAEIEKAWASGNRVSYNYWERNE